MLKDVAIVRELAVRVTEVAASPRICPKTALTFGPSRSCQGTRT